MIGPGKPGGEGFARRLNRGDWFKQNRDRRLTETEEMVFALVFCTVVGMIGAIGCVEGVRAIDSSMSR